MIPEGMRATFVVELMFCVLVMVMVTRARRGLKIPTVHKVPGLEAVDEAIGRATEMGKIVHYSPGTADVSSAETLASFAILSYVSSKCAEYDADLVVSNRRAIVYPITEEIVKQAYADQNKSSNLKPETVRFFSEDQWAYASACVGLIGRARPAANFFIGSYSAEALMLSEAGSQVGAIQIAGTAKTSQIPFFVVACDYCLIGEELFAAGAYLSKDPDRLGTLVAQDIGKMFAIGMVVIGLVVGLISPENNWLVALLKL